MLNTKGGFAGLVESILDLFNLILPVLAAAALLFFMYGVFQYIVHRGEGKNRDAMLWSLVTLFVLFSIWGILRVLHNSFLGATSGQERDTYYTAPWEDED